LEKGRGEWETLLSSVATLYTQGVDLNWTGFDRDYTRRRVALPTYPFERARYWPESEEVDPHAHARSLYQSLNLNGQQSHPLLGPPLRLAYPPESYVWETTLDKQRFPYLNNHRIKGKMVIPLSLYIEMIHAASMKIFETRFSKLAKIELKKVLFLPENTSLILQTVINAQTKEAANFSIYSRSSEEQEEASTSWTLHASGKILYK
jgi:acyl transferase domain-containing protein